jgi:PAS domain S-box-containing protein
MAAQLTELILDRAHNAVISMDQSGRVTYWNPAAETVFGVSREQVMGRKVAELIIPERLREAHSSGIRRLVAGGTGPLIDRRVEMPALRSDGGEFPVEMTISAGGRQRARAPGRGATPGVEGN